MTASWRALAAALVLALSLPGASLAAPVAAVPALTARASAAEPQQVLVFLRLPPAHFRGASDYSGSYDEGLGRAARRSIALSLARKQALTLETSWAMPILGVDCYVMNVPADRAPAEVARRLSQDPRVAWAEPMATYRAQGEAPRYNDPLYAAQPARQLWRLAELHGISTGRNVRVAVIDSMIDAHHPDLAGQIELRQNFMPERGDAPEEHGTAVAGVIAARGNNGVGIVGVAPEARLMALRACWQTPAQPANPWPTICNNLSLARAIDYAISHRAQVINLSLAGPGDILLGKLLDEAMRRGITVVGAYNGALPGGGFPASHPGVIAVAAVGAGPVTHGVYLAPGRGIPSTQPGGRWYLVNGSSFSAAHVSGLLALLLQRDAEGSAHLSLVASDGAGGEIDACATLLRLDSHCVCACATNVAVVRTATP